MHTAITVRVMLIGPGLPESLDCARIEASNPSIECVLIRMPGFDDMSNSRSRQSGLEFAVDILSQAINDPHSDNPAVLVSASRGATILTEVVRRGLWRKAVLLLSPILNGGDFLEEDGYHQMLSIFQQNCVPFLCATGSSIDEHVVIYEPLLEACVTLDIPPQRVKKFAGDHNWYTRGGHA